MPIAGYVTEELKNFTTGRLQGRGHGVPSVAWSDPAIP